MSAHPRFTAALIETPEALHRFLSAIEDAPLLTLDSEFMRTKTYYPQLCLVQIAGLEQAAAIDPFAPGLDLAPLWDFLHRSPALKVLHAAQQDLEIFLHLSGRLPAPLFDTQIAATVLGLGEQVGYEALVQTTLKQRLDKSQRISDWARRPLSSEQIRYALADVTYLMDAYAVIREQIKARQRESWIEAEMAQLSKPEQFRVSPDAAWRKLKLKGSHKPAVVAAAQTLAAWREREAQRRDLPRNRVIKDEVLLTLAEQRPEDLQSLSETRGLTPGLLRQFGAALLDALQRAQAIPPEAIPLVNKRPTVAKSLAQQLDMLRLLLRLRCEQAEVVSRLVANSEALADWLSGRQPSPDFLSGWRYETFGRDAEALVAGELWLGIENRRITFKRQKAP